MKDPLALRHEQFKSEQGPETVTSNVTIDFQIAHTFDQPGDTCTLLPRKQY